MRGKRIAELLSAEELSRKQPRKGEARQQQQQQQPDALTHRLRCLTTKALRFARRVGFLVVLLVAALVVHRNQQFHASATVFLNTAGHSETVRSVPTALPLSVAAALVAAWTD
jgi:hypothetical protein